ncbi:hypothetical protein [Candidatus Poriferisocius sp.]|uniref:hypothetical protein n=1 Tax=Candidatus Poriferisocius sp. TaxID=3101276 RepID=UPI003B01F3BE
MLVRYPRTNPGVCMSDLIDFKFRMGRGLRDRVRRAAQTDGLLIGEWVRMRLTESCQATEQRARTMDAVKRRVEAHRKKAP